MGAKARQSEWRGPSAAPPAWCSQRAAGGALLLVALTSCSAEPRRPEASGPSGAEPSPPAATASSTAQASTATATAAPGSSAPPTSTLPRCGPPPPEVAPLEDYSTVEDGKRYHTIAIYLDEFDQWLPEPTPPMPSNHSSRPEWTNRAEFSELAAPKSKRLRFTFELLRRTVEHVPSQHRWRVIYYSKIEEICRP